MSIRSRDIQDKKKNKHSFASGYQPPLLFFAKPPSPLNLPTVFDHDLNFPEYAGFEDQKNRKKEPEKTQEPPEISF